MLELRSDGLFYCFESPNTQWGNELLEHIRRGEISTSSFAFAVAPDPKSERWYKDGNTLKRTIYKIDKLFDVSPTFEGAYLTTTCVARNKEITDDVKKTSAEIDAKMELIKKELEDL